MWLAPERSQDRRRWQMMQVVKVGHPGFVGDLIRREDQVMARKSPYSAELRRRSVTMVADVRIEYDTEFAAITSVAGQLVSVNRASCVERSLRGPRPEIVRARGLSGPALRAPEVGWPPSNLWAVKDVQNAHRRCLRPQVSHLSPSSLPPTQGAC
jgi:hypothetical protein